jgi:hypothetical protein
LPHISRLIWSASVSSNVTPTLLARALALQRYPFVGN